MRRQIRESVEVLGGSGGSDGAARGDDTAQAGEERGKGAGASGREGARGTWLERRRLRRAERRHGRAASTAERAQARKVLVFQKAVTDLQTVRRRLYLVSPRKQLERSER